MVFPSRVEDFPSSIEGEQQDYKSGSCMASFFDDLRLNIHLKISGNCQVTTTGMNDNIENDLLNDVAGQLLNRPAA
jgi:hypothetical protein